MSDSLREQRPLLREDNSDEECQHEFNPPLRRHMGYRGKSKNTINGAAAVIKNWPDHWSSSVTYWWMGIAMFALITFIFYNSIVAYSLLPSADSTPFSRSVPDNKEENREQKITLPKVFMHVIVNDEKEVNLDKYLPYIEIIAAKYLHYKFNLIIMLNDTFQEEQQIRQANINNEDALNSLWAEHNILELNKMPSKRKSNIIIQHANLSNYLEDSPLRQFWRRVPYQFIGFLVRAVSIWDKGGIAFNPIILTPKSPDPIYIERLYRLLSSYEDLKKPNATMRINHKVTNIEKSKVLNDKLKYKKRVNNIRDIIDALERETIGPESQPEILSEAEDKQSLPKLEIRPSNIELGVLNNNTDVNSTEEKLLTEYFHGTSHTNKTIKLTNVKNKNHLIQNNRSDILNMMLPSFLDFLFHDKQKTTPQEENFSDLTATGKSLKISTRAVSTQTAKNNNKDNLMQPMIISAPTSFEKFHTKVEGTGFKSHDGLENLTIDLKGNILATKSPCHVFLGTIFSNIKHRTEEESLKDFIISELSLFCNGLLSTCKGVDVILL